MGHLRFLIFYLVCGIAAGLAHVAANADSVVPIIGASAAISGVLGAYLMLHPKAKVKMILFFGILFWTVRWPVGPPNTRKGELWIAQVIRHVF